MSYDYFTRVSDANGANALDRNPCKFLDFYRLIMGDGQTHEATTGDREALMILFGGKATVEAGGKTFKSIGRRPNVFSGRATAVYLPCHTEYRVTAHGGLDAGFPSAPSDLKVAPYLIEPAQVVEVQAGAANFSRTLNNILTPSAQPDLPARRLIVGETYVPSGNWSTYPPHKHEVDNLPAEVNHEEMYYFRMNPPEGFGICRHYSPDRGFDFNYTIKDSTILMAPYGYHTTCSGPGFANYFLWFLAGNLRTQAVALDPDIAWVQKAVPLIQQFR